MDSPIFCAASVPSVLSLWFLSLDHGGEESIRPMLGRKSPEEAVDGNNALCAHGLPQDTFDGAPRIDDSEVVPKRARHFADDGFVFLRLERTRGIHQPPVCRQMRESISEQECLTVMQILQVFGAELPPNFWVPGKRASAGAGDIDQNAIERAFERKRLRSVQDDSLHVSNAGEFESLLHGAHAICVEIRGDYMALGSSRARQE